MKRFWLAAAMVACLEITAMAPAQAQQGFATSAASRRVAQSGAVRPVADVTKAAGVDLAVLRSQMDLFTAYLDRDLQTNLENPFALLQDPKGMYLPGFGVAFHMEINLHPLRALNPFDTRPYTAGELEAVRKSKLERIEQLKAQLSDLLLAHGAELVALPPDQNVAVVVHLFNLPSERTDGLPLQLVLEISRGALQQFKDQKATAEDFRQRLTSLEF